MFICSIVINYHGICTVVFITYLLNDSCAAEITCDMFVGDTFHNREIGFQCFKEGSKQRPVFIPHPKRMVCAKSPSFMKMFYCSTFGISISVKIFELTICNYPSLILYYLLTRIVRVVSAALHQIEIR